MSESSPRRVDVERILKESGRAMHPRELLSRLSVSGDEYDYLLDLLEDMAAERVITMLPGGRVRYRGDGPPALGVKRLGAQGSAPQKKGPDETWIGALAVHPKGFGFVNAAGHEDVFIPPDSIFEALHGDTVAVRVVGRSARGTEGRIESIVKRRPARVTGILRKRGKSTWLDPDDSRLRGPIVITAASEGKDGDAAVADIVRFPDFASEAPEATLVEVLGRPGDPETEVRKILLRESVSEEHRPETVENARQVAAELAVPRLDGRRDLRHVPLPTIDPEDARDHDDAIWVERNGRGYRVTVAIADVSEFVREGSPLDEEARERGCTIYLPDRAIPMLPRVLAGDLCSLLPDVDRYCMAVIAELDASGAVEKYELVEGVMRSAAKLTYGGVARALGFDPESPQQPAAEAMKTELAVLAELAEKLRKGRMQKGALDLDLPEARVVVDDATHTPIEVKKRATRPGIKRAYSLVEEMMLLANELVARWMVEREVPAIYRVHGTPDPEKLERLGRVAQELGVSVRVDELERPGGPGKFLRQVAEHPRRAILEMLMLRSMKQATYEAKNSGHFGLASEAYLHFTSPIRRYPDLRVHRQLKRLLRGGKIDRSASAQEDLGLAATESSKKERSAMEVEREVLDLYRALYMMRHLGDTFEATVTGLAGAGLYAAIDEPFCDVFVPYEALGLGPTSLDDDEIAVIGERSKQRILLGDRITVTVVDVALLRRQVQAKRTSEGDEENDDEGPGSGALVFDDQRGWVVERRPRRTLPTGPGIPKRRGKDGARGKDATRGKAGDERGGALGGRGAASPARPGSTSRSASARRGAASSSRSRPGASRAAPPARADEHQRGGDERSGRGGGGTPSKAAAKKSAKSSNEGRITEHMKPSRTSGKGGAPSSRKSAKKHGASQHATKTAKKRGKR